MIIGSRALHYWCPDFKIHQDTDWDLVSTPLDLIGKIDYHIPSEYDMEEAIDKFSTTEYVDVQGYKFSVCSLEGLAAIKRSHLCIDRHWNKHITQYHRHLVLHNNGQHLDFIKKRQQSSLTAAKITNPKLTKNNTDFFKDAVTRKYDHDSIHEMVAFYSEPLYTKLKNNTEIAHCEKILWDQLSYQDKCRCVAEEATVIAIERFMVPSTWTHFPKLAYLKAIQKVCTTLTSGWFRDFAIDNYPALCMMYRPEVFLKVKELCP